MISAQRGKGDFCDARASQWHCLQRFAAENANKIQEEHVPILKNRDIFSVMRLGAGTGPSCLPKGLDPHAV